MTTASHAIVSFILGIASIFFGWIPLFGWGIIVAAIVFGISGIQQCNRDKKLEGRTFAVFGIIFAVLALVSMLAFLMLFGMIFFGIVSLANHIPLTCISDTGFSCDDIKIDESARQLQFTIQNDLQVDVENVRVNVEGENCDNSIEVGSVAKDEDIELYFQCGSTFPDFRFFSYTISYMLPGDVSSATEGVIFGGR